MEPTDIISERTYKTFLLNFLNRVRENDIEDIESELCEFTHNYVDKLSNEFLKRVWLTASDEEVKEFEKEGVANPDNPDGYRGYMIVCSRIINKTKERLKDADLL
jgi:hypothetical protein